jgi:7,8-dihydroneopterin aldolase/epimerase/oxygenase
MQKDIWARKEFIELRIANWEILKFNCYQFPNFLPAGRQAKFKNYKISSVVIISLKQLRFFAHHGLYEEERKVSNEFIVDLEVGFDAPSPIVTKMSETINYIKLYELVKKRMLQTTDLLETLAMSITEDIHQSYPQVKKVSIAITKKYPPVINFSGNVAVSYEKDF